MTKSIEDYLKEPYARILIPDEMGGYSAEILEFPGCFAEGETADEAMQALERAADSWIQAAIDQGQEIPRPSVKHGYSGRIALRLPKSLHRKIAQYAERDATSINQFILSAIAAKVGAENFYQGMISSLWNKMSEEFNFVSKAVIPQYVSITQAHTEPEYAPIIVDSLEYTVEVASNERGRRQLIPIIAKGDADKWLRQTDTFLTTKR